MSGLVYIGGFSGGIDSQAAARFMLNRDGAACVVLVNSDAGGNQHPGFTRVGCAPCINSAEAEETA